jgi:hypothetical protein
MCAEPGRPVVMARKAARSARGNAAAVSTTQFHLVSGRITASWSSSVRV